MKLIPKYKGGNKTKYNPRITSEGYDDKGYFALAMTPLPEITVTAGKSTNNERPVTMVTAGDLVYFNTGYNPSAGFVSGTDPLAELYVGGKALDPAFKWIGKQALVKAGKMGSNYARAKVISNEMNNSLGLVPRSGVVTTKRPKQKRLLNEGDPAPVYKGLTYEISDVVNPDGTVNIELANKIQKEIAKLYGVPDMAHRLENPVWHQTDPNTFLHTKEVTLRAYNMKTPKGFTKLEQVFAALGHDFGKLFAGDGHALIGADMLKLIFPNMSDDVYKAIAGHMGEANTSRSALSRYTKFADIKANPPEIEVSKPYIRINPTWEYANEAISISPKGKPDLFFQLIKDNKTPGLKIDPNGEYSVHFKTNRSKLLPEEKEEMFDVLESQIPEGVKVSTWGNLTPGGYSGINRFGNLYGYTRVGTRLTDIPVFLKFKSELDWSPKSWFGDAAKRTSWAPEDELILASHVPEYLEIERAAKANGTWLKMKDGSTWWGDPRSWVQMQSKEYKSNIGPSKLKTLSGDDIVYVHTSPAKFDHFDESKISTANDEGFHGRGFYLSPVKRKSDGIPYTHNNTETIPYAGEFGMGAGRKGNNNYLLVTRSDNPGYSIPIQEGGDITKLGFDSNSAGKPLLDFKESSLKHANEIVIPFANKIKSLLGNVGDFNLNNKNIYRVGIPILLGTSIIE